MWVMTLVFKNIVAISVLCRKSSFFKAYYILLKATEWDDFVCRLVARQRKRDAIVQFIGYPSPVFGGTMLQAK